MATRASAACRREAYVFGKGERLRARRTDPRAARDQGFAVVRQFRILVVAVVPLDDCVTV